MRHHTATHVLPALVLALALTAGATLARNVACDGGRCEGTKQDDVIEGANRRDRVFAGAGEDDVTAGRGADTLRGGPDDDSLRGGDGDDAYLSEDGDDVLFEGSNNSGDDTLDGGPGRDRITGGGDDELRGGPGDEVIGAAAAMFCGEGDDRLFGGSGSDRMQGDQGNDEYFGEDGNDVIDAAANESPGSLNEIDCGPGNDFVTANVNDDVADNCENVTRVPDPA